MKKHLANMEIQASKNTDRSNLLIEVTHRMVTHSIKCKAPYSCEMSYIDLSMYLHGFPIKLGLNLLFFQAFTGNCLDSLSDVSFEYLEWYLSTNANSFFGIILDFYSVSGEDYKNRNLVGCNKGCLGDFFTL